MSQRKLAYANNPGVAHRESSWIASRCHLHCETKEQAEAAIKKLIEAKEIVAVEEQ